MADRIEFNLVDNALDFVLSASERANATAPGDLKYAILHLFSGVELILKARLLETDWTLVFANPDKADEQALRTGDFRSVDFEGAWRRLVERVGLKLDRQVFHRLDSLRKLRNQTQHFQVQIPISRAKALLAQAGSFVIGFLRDHLPAAMNSRVTVLDRIHEQLRDFEQFVIERLRDIEGDIATAGTLIECPRCWQTTLVIGDYENPICYFCGGEFDAEEMAEESESARAERCPECEQWSAAVQLVGGNDGTMIWFCFRCGMDGEYRLCPRCNNLMAEEAGPCSLCMEEVLAKDD